MTFRNSILAGELLVRSGIRSPDYVPGVSGWRIAQDGSAELNDVIVRGVIAGGDLTGTLVVSGGIQSDDYDPGVAGWLIAGDGSAELNDVTARGVFRTAASGRRLEMGVTADKSLVQFFTGDPGEVTPGAITAIGDDLAIEAPNLTGLSIARITLDGTGGGTITLDTSDHVRVIGGQLRLSGNGAEELTFANDTDTGIGRGGANRLAMFCAGSARMQATTAGLRLNVDGTGAAPSVSWDTDPNTGIWHPAADQVGISAGGVNTILVLNGNISLNIPNSAVAVPAVQREAGFGTIRAFTSSRKAKTRIRSWRRPAPIAELRPVTFHPKAADPGRCAPCGDPANERAGFIAEEVAEVDRRLVTNNPETGEPTGLDTNAMLAAIVAELHELRARVAVLEETTHERGAP